MGRTVEVDKPRLDVLEGPSCADVINNDGGMSSLVVRWKDVTEAGLTGSIIDGYLGLFPENGNGSFLVVHTERCYPCWRKCIVEVSIQQGGLSNTTISNNDA